MLYFFGLLVGASYHPASDGIENRKETPRRYKVDPVLNSVTESRCLVYAVQGLRLLLWVPTVAETQQLGAARRKSAGDDCARRWNSGRVIAARHSIAGSVLLHEQDNRALSRG